MPINNTMILSQFHILQVNDANIASFICPSQHFLPPAFKSSSPPRIRTTKNCSNLVTLCQLVHILFIISPPSSSHYICVCVCWGATALTRNLNGIKSLPLLGERKKFFHFANLLHTVDDV